MIASSEYIFYSLSDCPCIADEDNGKDAETGSETMVGLSAGVGSTGDGAEFSTELEASKEEEDSEVKADDAEEL